MDVHSMDTYTPMAPSNSGGYGETNHPSANHSSSNAHLNASAPVFQPGVMIPSHSGLSSNISSTIGGQTQLDTPSRLNLQSLAVPSSFNYLTGPPLLSTASFNHQSTSPLFALPSPNLSNCGYLVSPGAVLPSPMTLTPSGWNMMQQSSSSNSSSSGKGSRRGSRGVPDYQPLKTTGHNSKPSVSINPAALAKVMALQKPKKKTILVRLPREVEESKDIVTILEEEEEEEEECTSQEADKKEEGLDLGKKQRKHAMQYPWIRRRPLEGVDINQMGPDLPFDCILSCQMYPESEHLSPEFIDIYLPIQGAWDALKKFFYQERIGHHDKDYDDGRTTESKSSTAEDEEGGRHAPEENVGADVAFSNSDNLPSVATPQNGPMKHLFSSPSTRRSQNMSLSVPSAGQPFGPSTLSALGLHSPQVEHTFSSSDTELGQTPALGERAEMKRLLSDQGSSRKSLQGGGGGKAKSLLKELGRGFGYSVESEDGGEQEAEEENMSSTYTPSRPPSRGQLHEQKMQEHGQDTNQAQRWQERRRQTSGINTEDEDEGDDDLTDSVSNCDNLSNPSDEEEVQRYKRILQEQEKAVMAITNQLQIHDLDQKRARSDTGQTFASSSINPEDVGEQQPRRYSILPRGPLDHDVRQEEGAYINSDYTLALPNSSRLHPNAPVFLPKSQNLASMKTPASFESSYNHKNQGSLNASAPAFTPGAFTFTAPEVAPKLPLLSSGANYHDKPCKDSQGREKRQRHRHEDDAEAESRLQSLKNGGAVLKPTAAPFYPTSSHNVTSQPPEESPQRRSLQHDQFNDATNDQENSSEQMKSSNSSRSPLGKRTPLAVVWQQEDAPFLQHQSSQQSSLTSRLSRFARNISGKSSDVATDDCDHTRSGNVVDDDIDDGTSDIIEELGDRMDSALEVWAERILDEVAIMGQVRPAHMVTLDTVEKQSLIELITKEMQSIIVTQFSSLQDATLKQVKLLQSNSTYNESTLSTTSQKEMKRQSNLDLDGQVDFDYVRDTLDQSMSVLQRDLCAAFQLAHSKATESFIKQVKESIDATKMDILVRKLDELAMSTSLKNMSTTLSGIPVENLETVGSILVERLRPILQEASDNSIRHRRAEITDVLEPLLEDHLARSQAIAKVDRQVVSHLMSEQITEETATRAKDWRQNLLEFKETFREQMNTALVESLLPHMEMLRTDHLNTDVIAARVVEVLSPILAGNRSSQDRLLPMESDVSRIIEEVVDKIQPVLTEAKDSKLQIRNEDGFLKRVVDAVGKGMESKVGEGSDLNTVIACLEPLVERQEESRSLMQKILNNQEETHDLPIAINAKLDVFLATNQGIQEVHQSILDKLDNPVNNRIHLNNEGKDEEDILLQLSQARQAEMEVRAELMESRVELSAATGYSSMLREECSRLEVRLDQAEKDANDLSLQMNELRLREKEAEERCTQAERQMTEAGAEKRDVQAALQSSQEQIQMLRSHVDAIAAEASELRQERAREREVSAQAIAEALASRKEADMILSKERTLKEEMMIQHQQSEMEARKLLQEHAERAAKAEGQVMTLEKRISEQDVKIGNLQQLSATQKQKAAQGGQKLAEVEKKLKEMEEKEKEWILTGARLEEMESRLRNQEQLEAILQSSQGNEARLREEVELHQARFADVERDLLQMKDTLVDREILDKANEQLAHSREEVALLKGRLVESQWRETEQQQRLPPPIIKRSSHGAQSAAAAAAATTTRRPTWDQSPSHGSTTWASIHASNSSIDEMDPTPATFNDDSFESVHHTTSSISHSHHLSNSNNSRTVEVNEDGWWS